MLKTVQKFCTKDAALTIKSGFVDFSVYINAHAREKNSPIELVPQKSFYTRRTDRGHSTARIPTLAFADY